jgi:hypothetical protein
MLNLHFFDEFGALTVQVGELLLEHGELSGSGVVRGFGLCQFDVHIIEVTELARERSEVAECAIDHL